MLSRQNPLGRAGISHVSSFSRSFICMTVTEEWLVIGRQHLLKWLFCIGVIQLVLKWLDTQNIQLWKLATAVLFTYILDPSFFLSVIIWKKFENQTTICTDSTERKLNIGTNEFKIINKKQPSDILNGFSSCLTFPRWKPVSDTEERAAAACRLRLNKRGMRGQIVPGFEGWVKI